jgi:ketosteroid isomerase-like protein
MHKRLTCFVIAACFLITTAGAADDDRTVDREAIRAHIDRIFQAFIHKDAAELRATHEQNWLGYLEGSRTMIRGVDGYMKWTGDFTPGSPYGMKSYKMREFDMIFKGDAAFVCFVADVEANTPTGMVTRALRITDFYTKQNGQWIQTGSDTDLHPESMAEQYQVSRALPDQARKQLLEARESVWRSYFSNDRAALDRLIPEELITIEPTGNDFGHRAAVLDGAARIAQSGVKLTRLEFPKTEIQFYGNSAIIYSTYLYELEKDGQRTPSSGRVTEVFVFRKGQWVNPGWHLDTTTQ